MGDSNQERYPEHTEMSEENRKEDVRVPIWERPVSRLYQYNRDLVGGRQQYKDIIEDIEKRSSNSITGQKVEETNVDHHKEDSADIKSVSNSGSSSAGSQSITSECSASVQYDVEEFLVKSYTQQIKEKNRIRAHEREVRTGLKKASGPITPIISSAINIRDFYVKNVANMR